MRTSFAVLLIALITALVAMTQERATPDPPGRAPLPAVEPGVGKRVGESVDRGLNNLGQRLRQGWAEIRQSIDELGVQGRVYGRLHWDKSLEKAPIEISVAEQSVVTLSGSVADEVARKAAIDLAQGTVGVSKVVDHLVLSSSPPRDVAPGTIPTSSPSAPDPTSPKQ